MKKHIEKVVMMTIYQKTTKLYTFIAKEKEPHLIDQVKDFMCQLFPDDVTMIKIIKRFQEIVLCVIICGNIWLLHY